MSTRLRKNNYNCIYAVRKGVLLVFSLWVLTILVIFSVYLAFGARQKLITLKRISERSTLRYAAYAGVQKAIVELSKDTTPGIDSFVEEFFNSELLFKALPIDLAVCDVSYFVQVGEGKERIFGIIDEERKINVNSAEVKTIQALIENVLSLDEARAQDLAASLVDFRDEDSTLSIPVGSAEDAYYRNLPTPYKCKDAAFENIDELIFVKGMNQNYLDKLRDFITIYGEGRININTAPREVLAAIGLNAGVIKKIDEFRSGDDKERGTEDDNIFTSASSIVAQLSQYTGLSSGEVANISNRVAEGAFGVGSKHFSITAEASLTYSKATMTIECVMKRDGTVLFFKEQ